MPKLKTEINKNDFICPKNNPEDINFIIKVDSKRIYLRRESDDHCWTIPYHTFNKMWAKVNPKVAKILYGQFGGDSDSKVVQD